MKKPQMIPQIGNGAVRPVIENVKPELDGARYAVKRIQGDTINVTAVVFMDGHDQQAAEILYRHESEKNWSSARMLNTGKRDIWTASFNAEKLGVYFFTVQAWMDRFGTWKHDLEKKHEAGQEAEVKVDLLSGADVALTSAKLAKGKDAARLRQIAKTLLNGGKGKATAKAIKLALDPAYAALIEKYPDKTNAAKYQKDLRVLVEREKAAYSSWYEFFPRSMSFDASKHGTFADCEKMLPYVASLGFDVVYLPPIHPIGTAHRKGKNNSLTAGPNDPGSPWGIGAPNGGHKSIHPELGTLADFKRFVAKARKLGIEIALDIAFQCSPDHPYVKEHPEWFKKRADGTIQYAENPPKKYQDIYPFYFESKGWASMWKELKSVIDFWIAQGVTIFRVDNPHTKATKFWEWMIGEVKKKHPETIFLAEAFTKPSMMYHLAKIGFGQSYTYFTWRNTKKEFKDYLDELTKSEVAEFYRPNFWPNTPDILPIHLQKGGRPAFVVRVALASTLSSNFGLYGPSYELCDNAVLKEGGEEYLNSEKYEIREWDLNAKVSIKDFIAKLNKIRHANKAFHRTTNTNFHNTTNENIVCFTKHTDDLSNVIFVAANLDFKNVQEGTAEVSLPALNLPAGGAINAKDLLSGKSETWKGAMKALKLDPEKNPVVIYKLELPQGKTKR